MLRRSPAVLSQHAGGVRVVHHQHRLVPATELDQVGKLGDRPFHGEDAVGDHHLDPAIVGRR